jgi:hypothetical protein
VPIREVVSQISPPIRIFLVLAVAVLGAYMLFLRPKPEEIPPLEPATDSTSVSKPGKIRDAAEDAVDAANGKASKQESGTATAPGAKGATTPAAPATPAEDLKGLPKGVRTAIRKDKVLVLLFWNPKSADDRLVRKSLNKVRTWDGRVFVQAAPLKRISRYGRIARGVNVEQSPTIVVADRNLKAETLVGYVDPTTINQSVVDALRNTTGLFTDTYLRKVDAVCARNSHRLAAIPGYYIQAPGQLNGRAAEFSRGYSSWVSEFKAVKAPKRWAKFRTASSADLATIAAAGERLSAAVGPNSSPADSRTAVARFNSVARPAEKRSDRRFGAEGLLRCGSQF